MDTFSDEGSIPDRESRPNEEVKKQLSKDRVKRWQDGLLPPDDLDAEYEGKTISYHEYWLARHSSS